MSTDVIKLLITLAFPLIAFLSLIIWLAVVLQTNRGMTVNLKLLGLSLSVSARSVAQERRGRGLVDNKESQNGKKVE